MYDHDDPPLFPLLLLVLIAGCALFVVLVMDDREPSQTTLLPEGACPFFKFFAPQAEALFPNEPLETIRQIKWGTRTGEIDGLTDGNPGNLPPVHVPEFPEEKVRFKMENVGDFMVVGEYTFYNAYLYRFNIRLPEPKPDQIRKFTEALIHKYGEPQEKVKYKNTWVWHGQIIEIAYRPDDGTVQYLFKPGISYIREDQDLKKLEQFKKVVDDL